MSKGEATLLVTLFLFGLVLVMANHFYKPQYHPLGTAQFFKGDMVIQLVSRKQAMVLESSCVTNPCTYRIRLPDNTTLTVEEFELRREQPTKE